MSIYKYLFAVFIFLTAIFGLNAQTKQPPTADSSVVVKKKKSKSSKKNQIDYNYLNPTKATILSAIIPGLGQAYNKRFWKIPLIYGLGGWTIYCAIDNNKVYQEARCNVNKIAKHAEETNESNLTIQNDNGNELTESQWRSIRGKAKRNRDVNIIYAVAIYGLQIVDAAVDAHLLRFHNSDRFLAELEPSFIQHQNNYVAALSLSLRLK